MLLITGTGRSGTHYTSRLMRELGYDIPHERIGKGGTASWKHIVSGRFAYIGKNRAAVNICSEGFTTILHQVRHPLKVIASMQTFGDSTWSFMAQHIQLDLKAPKVKRGMQAWVGWNQLIEKRAHWRFKIETLHESFDEFCLHAGIPPCQMPRIPVEAKDSRTKRYHPLTWHDLVKSDPVLAEQIRLLAMGYGYDDISDMPTPEPKGRWMLKFWR